MKSSFFKRMSGVLCVLRWMIVFTVWTSQAGAASTPLADQPVFVSSVPANVVLALSVEFPTAITRAYKGGALDTFDVTGATAYLGYFDPSKCYSYNGSYFTPAGSVISAKRDCSGQWSGNFMNWATMQAIDIFRWVMTGGNRVIDTPASFAGASGTPLGLTVLERAYASKQGSYWSNNFIDRYLPKAYVTSYTGLGSTYSSKDLWIRNAGLGTQVKFGAGASNCTGTSCPWTLSGGNTNESDTTCNTAPTLACPFYNVRVEVCRDIDGTGNNAESNCIAYVDSASGKKVYKPTGLMQKYHDRMYFGAFGYLNLSTSSAYDGLNSSTRTANLYKDGGVLRAPVKSIDYAITETGAFKTDPDAMINATLNIQDSGAVNYLNKFGSVSKSYKYYDPVSELYAEVIKYLKNLSPTPSYLPPSSPDPVIYDGFPVYTSWVDPAKDASDLSKPALSCRKNFVVGIGDTNTNYDFELNGAGPVGTPSVHNHVTPSGVDISVDVKAWTDLIGTLESMSSLGTKTISNGGYQIAGLAYYAHATDIRSDLSGNQTVTTYWMDVMESGFVNKNQYWLAAKYGGYVRPKGIDIGTFNSSTDTWNANGQKDSSNAALPDNYYEANNPVAMKTGLESAFKSIASGIGSSASAALSSQYLDPVSGGASTYLPSYDATNWTGNITASNITSYSQGLPVLTPLWSAQAKLDTLVAGSGWDTARKIVTLAPKDKTNATPAVSDLQGVPFRYANLGNAQALNLSKTSAVPAGNATDGQNVLNYLRGDRTNETTATLVKTYRMRDHILGDIVDSAPAYLGPPSAAYSDSYNPGYSTFVSQYASRTPLLIAGANDGMLHLFNANTGGEVFGLVPYALYAGPDANPEVSGIQALARPYYVHRYFVNGSVSEIRDVDFLRAGGATQSDTSKYEWHTLSVFGLGKGGRSYVAVDLTNPVGLSESQLAAKVLWEFTAPDMGFSFGRPLIAKTKRWGWVVLFSGGYNNTASGASKPGQGVLYVVDPRDGSLLQAIYTPVGSTTTPAGLTPITAFIPVSQDYTLDQAYAGDLQGNVWRFDFSDGSVSVPAPTQIAKLTDPSGNAQPITVPPKVEADPDTLKRYVFVGTGRLLAPEDIINSQQQSFYAIRDGLQSMAYGSGTNLLALPSGVSFPVGRSDLLANTSLLTGVSTANDSSMGWYFDLPGVVVTSTTTQRERVTVPLVASNGIISWIGSLLNDDPCSVNGVSFIYAVQYGSGKSVLTSTDPNTSLPVLVQSYSSSSGIVGIVLSRVGNGVSVGTTSSQGNFELKGLSTMTVAQPRVVNWRVIGQ